MLKCNQCYSQKKKEKQNKTKQNETKRSSAKTNLATKKETYL